MHGEKKLMEAVLPMRILRDSPRVLTASVRPDARPIASSSGAGGFFTRDRFRGCHLEISLNDFGLEESYGRFVREKAYAGEPREIRGSLVDLYV